MNLSRLIGVVLFLALAGCAANNPLTESAQRAAIVQIDLSLKLAADHDYVKAQSVIHEVIHAKDFGRLRCLWAASEGRKPERRDQTTNAWHVFPGST